MQTQNEKLSASQWWLGNANKIPKEDYHINFLRKYSKKWYWSDVGYWIIMLIFFPIMIFGVASGVIILIGLIVLSTKVPLSISIPTGVFFLISIIYYIKKNYDEYKYKLKDNVFINPKSEKLSGIEYKLSKIFC